MRTIAVMNQKGGSGKTTTAVSLSAIFAEKGYRVLLVDMDAQGNATTWLRGDPRHGELSYALLEAADGDIDAAAEHFAQAIHETPVKNLDCVWGAARLPRVERALAPEQKAPFCLRDAMRDARKQYDLCFVDCRPSQGLPVVASLVAADEVLVPVEAHALALAGIGDLMGTVEAVRGSLNGALRIGGIFATKVDLRTTLSKEVIAYLEKSVGPLLLGTHVRTSIRLAECWSHKEPIHQYAPQSSGAKDYQSLADELDNVWRGANRCAA